MEPADAARSLSYAESVRRRARGDATSAWLPLLALGALALGSVAFARPAEHSALQSYWLIAGPLGGIAIAFYAYRQARGRGIEAASARYILAAVELMALAIATALVVGPFDGTWQTRFGPAVVVGAGYLAFAWLERNIAVAAIAAALLAAIVLLAAFRPAHPWTDAMLTVLYGVALVASAIGLRTRRAHA